MSLWQQGQGDDELLHCLCFVHINENTYTNICTQTTNIHTQTHIQLQVYTQHTYTPRGVRGSLNLRVHKLAVEAAWGIPVPCAYAINMWTPVLCLCAVCCCVWILSAFLFVWILAYPGIHHYVTFLCWVFTKQLQVLFVQLLSYPELFKVFKM